MLAPGAEVRDQEQGQRERDHAERQVHGEDRAPAEVADEKAAHRRAGHDRESGDRAVDGEHAAALFGGEERQHQGQPLRREHGGAKSLEPARQNQLRRVLGQGAEAGGDREDDDAHGEEVARTVDVAEPRRADQKDGVEKAVGVQHPQHLVEARVQPAENRRDRDVDDGEVEQGHEDAQGQDGEGGGGAVRDGSHGGPRLLEGEAGQVDGRRDQDEEQAKPYGRVPAAPALARRPCRRTLEMTVDFTHFRFLLTMLGTQ